LERITIAIIGVLAAAAIPGAVEIYKTNREITKADREIALKDK
jgi:type II secretory pathway pseudopilin PulG